MTKPHDRDIPIAYLRESFILDPATPSGLRWRKRPREHFLPQAWIRWNTRYAGATAGRLDGEGYLRVTLTRGGRKHFLYAHRIVFALINDRWPVDRVDHEKGVEAGNRITNLREATTAQNGQNRKLDAHSTSGFAGVGKSSWRGWQARIGVGGRRIWLGHFATREEAVVAYLKAKAELHSFQPTPREMGK